MEEIITELKETAKFAIVDSPFDMRIFTSDPKEPLPERTREFGKEKVVFSIQSKHCLTVREQSVFLSLLYLAGHQRAKDRNFGEQIALFKLSLNKIRKITGYKGNTNDVWDSILKLSEVTYRSSDMPDDDGDLLDLFGDEIFLHNRFSAAIDHAIQRGVVNELSYDFRFYTVDLDQRQQLSGEHAQLAKLIHAWFSSTVKFGQRSMPFKLKTLLTSIKHISGNEKKKALEAQLSRCKKALCRLEELGYWKVLHDSKTHNYYVQRAHLYDVSDQ